MSPQKTDAIKKAREASIISNNQKSPRVKGVERAIEALLWVYRFGWSTPTILELALNTSGRSGLANRLIKNGLLVRTMTPSGGIGNTPSSIVTLSRMGLEFITAHHETLISYEINPTKIKFSIVNHDDKVQRLTANRLNSYRDGALITSYISENELASGKEKGEKIPDAIWNLEYFEGVREDEKVALEVELSAKWGRELDTFVYQTLRQFNTGVCNAVEIYADSPALLLRYRKAFAPGNQLQTWTKGKGRTAQWSKGSKITIPDRDPDQVRFIKIEPKMLRPERKTIECDAL